MPRSRTNPSYSRIINFAITTNIIYSSGRASDCEEESLPGATQSAARFGIRDGRLTDNELLFFAHARWITKRRPSSRRHIAVRLTEGQSRHIGLVLYIILRRYRAPASLRYDRQLSSWQYAAGNETRRLLENIAERDRIQPAAIPET